MGVGVILAFYSPGGRGQFPLGERGGGGRKKSSGIMLEAALEPSFLCPLLLWRSFDALSTRICVRPSVDPVRR